MKRLNDYFVQLQKLLPTNAKLSYTRSFHLTLKFLGKLKTDEVDKVTDILKNIKFNAFSVSLDSIGVFPTENYIRVLWVGLNPEDKVIQLQNQIDESLISLFKKEKDFKSHITLARVKYPEDKKAFMEQLRKIEVKDKKLEVKDFRLVKSRLTPQGPVYEDIEVFECY